ncbi:MAG: hypothetical protein LBM60_00725 [Clostridium sp.]|nr:hypothetical protein [Clostridium sp.]
MKKKTLPQITAIVFSKQNNESTLYSLPCCSSQIEAIFCVDHIGTEMSGCADDIGVEMFDCADHIGVYADHVGAEMSVCTDHVGAALARAKGDYICILPAGTVLHDEYLSYPIAYLERHPEFDYSVCDPTHVASHGSIKDVHKPTLNSLQITDYFLGESTFDIAAFIVRKAFLVETGLLLVAANATFPELLILPILAFGYGVHIAKSLYSADQTFIVPEKLNSYVAQAHDIIERFPISASDIRELLLGFDFMTTRKLLSVYDCDRAATFSDYICRSVNHALEPSPAVRLTVLADSVKTNKLILLTALNLACAGKSAKRLKPVGRVIVFTPLSHSAVKIHESLRHTVYEPDVVWAMNADGLSATTPDLPSLSASDTLIVPRSTVALEKEFAPASIVAIQDALNCCAALTFPTLCDGNTTIRFSSGYFYDY